eukprot:jgi/Orpsp1_1/1185216/evm.model.c7180000092818.1
MSKIISCTPSLNNTTNSQFKKELENLIPKIENIEIINEDYYEWKIDNFSSIQNNKISPKFNILNYKWKIEIIIKNNGYINLKLKNVNASSLQRNKFINANCVFAIRNSKEFSSFKASCSYNKFSNNNSEIKFNDFIKKNDLNIKLRNATTSIVQNNCCTICVYIRIYRNDIN